MYNKDITTKDKENRMTFKVNDNDVTKACKLAKMLTDKDWGVWFSIKGSDVSACKWWIAPLGTNPHDATMHSGGVGALIHQLRTACIDSGAIQRPVHVSFRHNHTIRLSSDANGKCWTTSNGG